MKFVDIEPSAPRKPTVVASFDGRCACGGEIEGGWTELTLEDDEWICCPE